jgi:WD40-like Beta Propeller Repeat
MPRRGRWFAAIAVACVVGTGAAIAVAVVGAHSDRVEAEQAVAAGRPSVERILASGDPFVVYRDLHESSTNGQLTIAPIAGSRPGTGVPAGPFCSRAAFAAGRGICLDVLGTSMKAMLMDDRLRVVRELKLTGVPSRAQISPDGRWGGVTAFVAGHAYAEPGSFSTVATIIDLDRREVVGDLENDFTVRVDGEVLDDRDRNYWGLTFADDGDTFYATAASGDRTWLIKGSIEDRTAHPIHENVECPSLSPDGTRIAYKKAIDTNPSVWRLHVLDLATGRETALAEDRSIDDQLAWLDDEHLLYADGDQTTWVTRADGTGTPEQWLEDANSATVARDRR